MADPRAARFTADAWIRAMDANRGEGGGSQPHLFHTDGGEYLVKVRNNPQGFRVLPNELLSGLLLDYLGVRHPQPAIVSIPKDVINDSPGAVFAEGTPLAPAPPSGPSTGSRTPAGPSIPS